MTSLGAAADRFRALHHGRSALVLPNVWDPVSARVFAAAGFPALATSSSAVAATLGYEDGEQTPREAMFAAIAPIVRSVDVPVTADVEAGYGLGPDELVARLAEAGAVGCNVEDSDPRTKKLKDVAKHADYLAAILDSAAGSLVINARVDIFLAGRAGPADPMGTAIDRARRYLAASADCTYPILAPPEVLPQLVAAVDGPVNAIHVPGGPSLAELSAMGVARITFGGGLHRRATDAVREVAASISAEAATEPRAE